MIMNLALLLPLLFVASSWAKPAAETQQQQTSALQTCLEKIQSEVCDPSGVLSQEQQQKLNDALVQMQKQTEQEGYAYDKQQRSKCGQKGVIMPIIVLKGESGQELAATEKMLIDANKQWTLKNPCDRVAIMMLNTAEKIELRRFWAGRNWNVNVEPAEIVQLYQKEIPLVVKADYVQALLNMLQQFTKIVSERPGAPSDQKVVQQKQGGGGGAGGQQAPPQTAASTDSESNSEQKGDQQMVKGEGSPAATAGEAQGQ